MATKRKHVGEEAEQVSWADCRAANELAAEMLAGQIDPMSLIVDAPKRPQAVVVDE